MLACIVAASKSAVDSDVVSGKVQGKCLRDQESNPDSSCTDCCKSIERDSNGISDHQESQKEVGILFDQVKDVSNSNADELEHGH